MATLAPALATALLIARPVDSKAARLRAEQQEYKIVRDHSEVSDAQIAKSRRAKERAEMGFDQYVILYRGTAESAFIRRSAEQLLLVGSFRFRYASS